MVDKKTNLIAIDPFNNSLLHLPPLQNEIWKVRIHTLPTSSDEDIIAVAICGSELNSIAFVRPGDITWKYVDTLPLDGYDTFKEVVVYNEKFYIVSSAGKLLILDPRGGGAASSPTLRLEFFFDMEVGPIWSYAAGVENHLVESSTGELWHVLMKEDNICYRMSVISAPRIEIYRLVESEARPRWVEVEKMGDHQGMMFGENCVIFSARESPDWLKEECIYFMDSYCSYMSDKKFLKVYDCEKGVTSDLTKEAFIPDLDSDSSNEESREPLWIVPKLI